MLKKTICATCALLAAAAMGYYAGRSTTVVQASDSQVYELRTYTAEPGKLEDLHSRFRNHTLRIFNKHGMTNLVYLRPHDEPLKSNTLTYLISHSSREQAKKNWSAFGSDPEWQKVARESQLNGKLVTKVDSIFFDPADYSPMK